MWKLKLRPDPVASWIFWECLFFSVYYAWCKIQKKKAQIPKIILCSTNPSSETPKLHYGYIIDILIEFIFEQVFRVSDGGFVQRSIIFSFIHLAKKIRFGAWTCCFYDILDPPEYFWIFWLSFSPFTPPSSRCKCGTTKINDNIPKMNFIKGNFD